MMIGKTNTAETTGRGRGDQGSAVTAHAELVP